MKKEEPLDKSAYVIAEFRFPYKIQGGKSLTSIADDAIVAFEKEYGFTPKKWNLRLTLFENNAVGGVDHFFNPAGNLIIQHDKNHNKAKEQ